MYVSVRCSVDRIKVTDCTGGREVIIINYIL